MKDGGAQTHNVGAGGSPTVCTNDDAAFKLDRHDRGLIYGTLDWNGHFRRETSAPLDLPPQF